MPDQKSPLDQVLDLFVFAPLGLALTAKDQLPDLVEKGRSRVESQVTMARFVGQFAVQQGRAELEKRLRPVADRSPSAGPSRPADEPAPAPAPASPVHEPGASPPSSAPAGNGSSPSSGGLAIPGYDALSASQVVQRLAGLAGDELEEVRRYEAATRGRKTVLSKIAQLQA